MSLPELSELLEVIEKFGPRVRTEVLAEIPYKSKTYPIHALALGSAEPEAPVFGLVGGVHGLERIGTTVVISYLRTIAELLRWDGMMHALLKRMRLVFVPLVNPVGMLLQQRSNPQGVDLMRNAPVEADPGVAALLIGGQRFSRRIAWYRGRIADPMEAEAQALCRFVQREVFPSKIAITVDVHSGFGFEDRLWFPYARSQQPFPKLSEVFALKTLLDATYPHHPYRIEPQVRHYGTHGDLWDYLFDLHAKASPHNVYIPFSLEIGSWRWIRKDPLQLRTILGPFNPLKPYRRKQALRRHLILFDFLTRVIVSARGWARMNPEKRRSCRDQALSLWYPPAHGHGGV